MEVPVIAGAVASAVFASSTLPMLAKARRTKDVRSYSPTNIALANIGNLVYMIYVLDLPPGPIWALHLFHTISSGLMLVWYLRYVVLAERVPRVPAREPALRRAVRVASPVGAPRPGVLPGRTGGAAIACRCT